MSIILTVHVDKIQLRKVFFRLSKVLFAGPKSWNHIGFDFYN